MPYLIELLEITKHYNRVHSEVSVLNGINFHVTTGEFIAIMGPSGAGKSTLLHIIGCLDRPSSGKYLLDGKDVFTSDDRELSRIRSNHIGFIFQTFNLIPQLTVLENVELPFLYRTNSDQITNNHAVYAIREVGLLNRIHHKPAELSGGEMQRVAIARALAIKPTLILADEPTGNLDSTTSAEIMDLFHKLYFNGVTIVMVTHNLEVASRAERIVTLKDGKFVPNTETVQTK